MPDLREARYPGDGDACRQGEREADDDRESDLDEGARLLARKTRRLFAAPDVSTGIRPTVRSYSARTAEETETERS